MSLCNTSMGSTLYFTLQILSRLNEEAARYCLLASVLGTRSDNDKFRRRLRTTRSRVWEHVTQAHNKLIPILKRYSYTKAMYLNCLFGILYMSVRLSVCLILCQWSCLKRQHDLYPLICKNIPGVKHFEIVSTLTSFPSQVHLDLVTPDCDREKGVSKYIFMLLFCFFFKWQW